MAYIFWNGKEMRHAPKISYNGLTIVVSNKSRFDTYQLISANAGHFFDQYCLQGISRLACDIRTSDTKQAGLLPNTKVILLLGEKAFHEWTKPFLYKDYTIGEQRGSPLENEYHLPMIASYFPQDCMDYVDYESKFNPQEYAIQNEQDKEEEIEDVKRKGKTRRSNWKFWLSRDVRKCLSLITSEHVPYCYGDSEIEKTRFIISPNSKEIEEVVLSHRGDSLYLDIETDTWGDYNLSCIGIAFSDGPVYVIPIWRYNQLLHYGLETTSKIFAALAISMSRNEVVCHYSKFDLLIMAWRYGLPFGRRNYDTMEAHDRCFPGMEKSLGHGISNFLWEPYHKDEGIFEPKNTEQEQQLWRYNAKDVAGMRLLRRAIDNYSKTIPGLQESIIQTNATIYPYLLNTCAGIHFNEDKRAAIVRENDRLMTQYIRIINLVKGDNYKEILLPTSSKSCVKFFHDYLHYDVVSRSKRISKKTGKYLNTPSLDEKAMLKLKLKYPGNPLIDFCLKYRQAKKESSTSMFQEWDIMKYRNYAL